LKFNFIILFDLINLEIIANTTAFFLFLYIKFITSRKQA
jgi:hypothetical protein